MQGSNRMSAEEIEEIRWQLIKAMLDEFPSLKQRAKAYIKQQH
jgi:hypothetical protein